MDIQIPLGHGLVAVIDDSDMPLIVGYSWHSAKSGNTYYAKASGSNPKGVPGQYTVRMHRLIMGAKPGQIVDHRDGDGLNNRRSNLRFATIQGNRSNGRKRRDCLSQYKGVTKDNGRWRAQIVVNRVNRRLGTFDDEEAAARAYDAAALAAFGEFARLNFPEAK